MRPLAFPRAAHLLGKPAATTKPALAISRLQESIAIASIRARPSRIGVLLQDASITSKAPKTTRFMLPDADRNGAAIYAVSRLSPAEYEPCGRLRG
jgi:hypothetical protein